MALVIILEVLQCLMQGRIGNGNGLGRECSNRANLPQLCHLWIDPPQVRLLGGICGWPGKMVKRTLAVVIITVICRVINTVIGDNTLK